MMMTPHAEWLILGFHRGGQIPAAGYAARSMLRRPIAAEGSAYRPLVLNLMCGDRGHMPVRRSTDQQLSPLRPPRWLLNADPAEARSLAGLLV
jgi:hypothetical protein